MQIAQFRKQDKTSLPQGLQALDIQADQLFKLDAFGPKFLEERGEDTLFILRLSNLVSV
jgi:hypothetical protein